MTLEEIDEFAAQARPSLFHGTPDNKLHPWTLGERNSVRQLVQRIAQAERERVLAEVETVHPLGEWMHRGFMEDPWEDIKGCTKCKSFGLCPTLKVVARLKEES